MCSLPAGPSHCLTQSVCLWSCSAFPETLTPLTESSCLSVLTPASLSTTKDAVSPLHRTLSLHYTGRCLSTPKDYALLSQFSADFYSQHFLMHFFPLPSFLLCPLSSTSFYHLTEGSVSQDCILSPGFDSLPLSHYLLPSPTENSWQSALKQTGIEKTPWSQKPGFHLW